MAVASYSNGQAELVAIAMCLEKQHDMAVLVKCQALGQTNSQLADLDRPVQLRKKAAEPGLLS